MKLPKVKIVLVAFYFILLCGYEKDVMINFTPAFNPRGTLGEFD